MQWLAENWLLLLLGGGMIAMHLFGHGRGHGGCGHGGHGRGGKSRKPVGDEAGKTGPTEEPADV